MKKTGCKRGFTLIELLVVVLIIGVLAAVALPQYQVAVEKTRATQILPMMRHISDALALYKLEHGSYFKDSEGSRPLWNDLGIEPPAGFKTTDTGTMEYWNDTWGCMPNEEGNGDVYCTNNQYAYTLCIFQSDDIPEYAGKRTCVSSVGTFGEKVCKALGGKAIENREGAYFF